MRQKWSSRSLRAEVMTVVIPEVFSGADRKPFTFMYSPSR